LQDFIKKRKFISITSEQNTIKKTGRPRDATEHYKVNLLHFLLYKHLPYNYLKTKLKNLEKVIFRELLLKKTHLLCLISQAIPLNPNDLLKLTK